MDSLFADGLKNLSVPPNPKVWEGINNQLMAAKKKKLFAIYMWTGVAASILLLLALGNHYFMGQLNYNMQLNTLSENSTTLKNDSVQDLNQQIDLGVDTKIKRELTNSANVSSGLFTPENREGEVMIANRTSQKHVNDINSQIASQASQNENLRDDNSQKIFANSSVGSQLKKLLESNDTDIKKSNGDILFLSKDKDLAFVDSEFVNVSMNLTLEEKLSNFEYNLPSQLVPNTSQLNKTEDYALLADEIQIQQNILTIEQLGHEKNKENRWSIIGQVSSTYSSYSGDSKGSNIESGIWSVGGGAKVNYAMNEKLAFQTGIVYNRFGQDLSSGRGGRDWAADATSNPDANLIPEEKLLGSVVSYPSVTSAGVIRLSGGSNLPMADPARDEFASSYSSSYSSSADLIQSFKAIEIPFLMRYNLIQKQVGVFVSGGISANMIVGNGVYDQSDGGNKKIGEIEGIRATNFSSQFSFGLEYRLNSKLQIGLEPSVKYYLNSINTSSQYQYKPYSIGIFTGIRYDF